MYGMPTTSADPEPDEFIQSTAAHVGDTVGDDDANVYDDPVKPKCPLNHVDNGAKQSQAARRKSRRWGQAPVQL